LVAQRLPSGARPSGAGNARFGIYSVTCRGPYRAIWIPDVHALNQGAREHARGSSSSSPTLILTPDFWILLFSVSPNPGIASRLTKRQPLPGWDDSFLHDSARCNGSNPFRQAR